MLIENAIKYGRENTRIDIHVSAEDQTAILKVSNLSDFPIDPIHCFDRGSRYAADSAEGSGYGLFLAREIVQAHGGTIHCERNGSQVIMIASLPLQTVIDFT